MIASSRSTHIVLAVYVAVLAAGFGGCAKKEESLPLFAAKGQVRVGNSPAKGVSVTLYPATQQDPRVGALRPHAITGSDGSFTLGTYITGDGAPQGEWMVALAWPDDRLPPAQQEEILANGDALPDRLRGRFSTPGNTSPRISITAGENNLPPIELPY